MKKGFSVAAKARTSGKKPLAALEDTLPLLQRYQQWFRPTFFGLINEGPWLAEWKIPRRQSSDISHLSVGRRRESVEFR